MQPTPDIVTDATPDEVTLIPGETGASMSVEDMIASLLGLPQQEPLTKREKRRAQQDPVEIQKTKKAARKRAANSRRRNRNG